MSRQGWELEGSGSLSALAGFCPALSLSFPSHCTAKPPVAPPAFESLPGAGVARSQNSRRGAGEVRVGALPRPGGTRQVGR